MVLSTERAGQWACVERWNEESMRAERNEIETRSRFVLDLVSVVGEGGGLVLKVYSIPLLS